MRKKLAVAKALPLVHRFFASHRVSKNGGFYALLPSPSPRHCHHVPAALARNSHVQSFNRRHLKSLGLRGKTTERAERTAAETRWSDTLFSSPGAISADVETQRLFIADTSHHRIIIADGDGKIVDCIGSTPGMEDGTFETAQLCYPASVVFDAYRNFLYIADSENHVVRRANLSSRTLNTVSPAKMNSGSTMWGRLLRWMGASQPSKSEQDSERSGERDNLRYPWHVKLTEHGFLLVASRRFENVWELDSSSGEVFEFQFQDSEVASEEFCRKAIDVKAMEDVHSLILHEMKGTENPWQISSVSDIVSRVGRLHNKLFFIDTDGQIIRTYNLDTGCHDILHLSNLGLLGFPSWWSLPSLSFQSPNCVNTSDDLAKSTDREADRLGNQIHIQPGWKTWNLGVSAFHGQFLSTEVGRWSTQYPWVEFQREGRVTLVETAAVGLFDAKVGRCLLCINPILPKGMVWAGPLEEGSIWRQAKGSVVELSMFGGNLISHKISSAQQWIDDLDNLDDPDFETLETDVTLPPESDSGIPLYALVDATLGTGEVIVDAVLYLKYAVSESQDEFPGSREGTDMEVVFQERALQDHIVLKQLHLEVRLEIETNAPEERTQHINVQL